MLKSFLFYFINFAKTQTNKQTNRKNVDRDNATAIIIAAPDTNWIKNKKNPRNNKKYSDTRKTTATYNKLLDETSDEQYYILNR